MVNLLIALKIMVKNTVLNLNMTVLHESVMMPAKNNQEEDLRLTQTCYDRNRMYVTERKKNIVCDRHRFSVTDMDCV